jgi:curved DNA-binding protein CbpA
MQSEIKNYYEVLEVAPGASQEEIMQAYNRAKNAYTGDSIALYSLLSQEEADKVLNLIEEAFNILSCPDKRIKYNKARGINVEEKPQGAQAKEPSNEHQKDEEESLEQFHKPDPKSSANMNKLVAQQRYGLDFNVDPDFEVEIEQCTEFSGEFLQKIREYKNVDVNRLADMTKISKTYIRYIEADEFQKMPALVYVRGFVYQYAKCLKLNPDLVSNSYVFHIKKLKGEA